MHFLSQGNASSFRSQIWMHVLPFDEIQLFDIFHASAVHYKDKIACSCSSPVQGRACIRQSHLFIQKTFVYQIKQDRKPIQWIIPEHCWNVHISITCEIVTQVIALLTAFAITITKSHWPTFILKIWHFVQVKCCNVLHLYML